ncbi:hypothetical protein E2C01_063892 [Portunus trituberculatus]|uniref:Uncharacterized protein n=1 Tax=Portunus trituberculatus TaxID=210409 RepID=A0A5B7HEW9_PORTR|nr:hypothetical protein [Portunus trituberculatus]
MQHQYLGESGVAACYPQPNNSPPALSSQHTAKPPPLHTFLIQYILLFLYFLLSSVRLVSPSPKPQSLQFPLIQYNHHIYSLLLLSSPPPLPEPHPILPAIHSLIKPSSLFYNNLYQSPSLHSLLNHNLPFPPSFPSAPNATYTSRPAASFPSQQQGGVGRVQVVRSSWDY